MTIRFAVDLLHPGRLARTRREWFLGPQGRRCLLLLTLAGAGLVLLIAVGVIFPTHRRLSAELAETHKLRTSLAAAEGDLRTMRGSLADLAAEAKRRVRWAELLNALSRHIPPTVRLQRVEHASVPPSSTPDQQQQQPQQEPKQPEPTLQIEALTPLQPGSPHLADLARFMAALVRDPAMEGRFQLKSWEIKPPTAGTPEGTELLQIRITFTERAQ